MRSGKADVSGLLQSIPGLALTRKDRESVTRLLNESGTRELQVLSSAIESGSPLRIAHALQYLAQELGCYIKPIDEIAARITSVSIADSRPPQLG